MFYTRVGRRSLTLRSEATSRQSLSVDAALPGQINKYAHCDPTKVIITNTMNCELKLLYALQRFLFQAIIVLHKV